MLHVDRQGRKGYAPTRGDRTAPRKRPARRNHAHRGHAPAEGDGSTSSIGQSRDFIRPNGRKCRARIEQGLSRKRSTDRRAGFRDAGRRVFRARRPRPRRRHRQRSYRAEAGPFAPHPGPRGGHDAPRSRAPPPPRVGPRHGGQGPPHAGRDRSPVRGRGASLYRLKGGSRPRSLAETSAAQRAVEAEKVNDLERSGLAPQGNSVGSWLRPTSPGRPDHRRKARSSRVFPLRGWNCRC
jgi:hypothetical protein